MHNRQIYHFLSEFHHTVGDAVKIPTVPITTISGLSGLSDQLINFPANSLERVAHQFLETMTSRSDCPICKEPLDFTKFEQIAVTICGHINHKYCLDKWLEHIPAMQLPTCPCCRQHLAQRYFSFKQLLESIRFQFELTCLSMPDGCYRPRMVKTKAVSSWYWFNDENVPIPYESEVSSQIQQSVETGLPTLIMLTVRNSPAFYMFIPGSNCQIKVELEIQYQRKLIEIENTMSNKMSVVNDDGNQYPLPETTVTQIKRAMSEDQRIIVVNSKSTNPITVDSYWYLSKIRVERFKELYGDLYCLHIGSKFQIKLELEPDHRGLLKIRKCESREASQIVPSVSTSVES